MSAKQNLAQIEHEQLNLSHLRRQGRDASRRAGGALPPGAEITVERQATNDSHSLVQILLWRSSEGEDG